MIRRADPAPDRLEAFDVHLRINIRQTRAEDLEALEWFGWFSAQRVFIEEAFRRQRRGEVVMLIADAGGFPVGQLWVDLARKAAEGVGLLWALRVLPGFQRSGIGTHLIAAAETILRERRFRMSEIGVDRNDRAVLRMYERLGYVVQGEEREIVTYAAPDGQRRTMEIDQWILRKTLAPSHARKIRVVSNGSNGTRTERPRGEG